jgi:uncharacterized membrane protein
MMEEDSHGIVNKTRLENLTDAFFATVMTILVLTLVVPVFTGQNISVQLKSGLLALLPNVLGYVISFIVLGVLWIGHNNLFRHLTKSNRRLQWLTLLLLLSIGFIPFSTALLGRYPTQQLTVMLFGLNLFVTSIMFLSIWFYVSSNKRLVHGDLNEKIIRSQTKRIIVSPIAYIIAILFSFVNTNISIAIYAIVAIYYIIIGLVLDEEI